MKCVVQLFFFLAAALISANAAAAPIIINFDSLADLEGVDNQFVGLGADFGGTAQVLSAGVSLNPLYLPFSAPNVVYNPQSLMRIDAVGGLWASAGGYITGNSVITLRAFDSADQLIDFESTSGPNYIGAGVPNTFLSVSGANIAYVTISDSGNTFTLDNFQFEVASVPEPTTIVLWGMIAFGGSLAYRRRRQA